ncbi:transcription factor Hsf1 [Ephemerocybe angulata]|uniref:Transcription factor Hsf1 n=1 Tax=Ephemerocybe angulata TaxID=980116 RepID=A0A8H6MC22_9AGAR|nr:transcription factor Hsf1 [Tulosesus angulatus]
MASDHQMAVARTARSLPPGQISKSTRQVVPAFLQKLYEMVNDPKNSELIRWSDTGDSFFVLDHERFAHDVLGRWFKHRNFSSFVRQLNMYGFHKIPHLQQGVLKSDTETEYWNFAHANFHRGQPDLLCLIQRKKTANQANIDDVNVDLRDAQQISGATANSVPGPSTTANQGQVLDVQAIVSGIAAIKRHQTTISAELNELKRSNQLLWQDSMQARARHQKQQDTINRIVKFLAGVFGHSGAHNEDDTVQDSPPHAVVPRRPARFMIEDAKRDGKNIVEMDDLETFSNANVETPMSINSPAPSDYIAASEGAPSPNTTDTTSQTTPHQPQPTVSQPTTRADANHDVDVRAVTPTRLNSNPKYELDNRLQGYLSTLSPMQIQQLVNSLASNPIPDFNSSNPMPTDPTPSSAPEPSSSSNTNANSHLTHYAPPAFDFSSITNSTPNSVFTSSLSLPTPSESLISFNPYDTLSPPELDRQWKAAEDIDKDVNALNSSIHQLIQTFGLDPNLVDVGGNGTTDTDHFAGSDAVDSAVSELGRAAAASAAAGTMPMDLNMPMSADFDFDSFLNALPSSTDGNGMDFTDAASTAFLDEAPSPTGSAASPIANLRHLSPDVSTNGSGKAGQLGAGFGFNAKKRKSDVSELDPASLPSLLVPQVNGIGGDGTLSPTTGKAKRRKEK